MDGEDRTTLRLFATLSAASLLAYLAWSEAVEAFLGKASLLLFKLIEVVG